MSYFFEVVYNESVSPPGALGVYTDRVSVFAMEGDSVSLNTNAKTSHQKKIKWFFNDTRIAQISDYLSKTCTDVQCNEGTERFRDRLKLDHQTESLTITNTRTTDSGVYHLEIITNSSSIHRQHSIRIISEKSHSENVTSEYNSNIQITFIDKV